MRGGVERRMTTRGMHKPNAAPSKASGNINKLHKLPASPGSTPQDLDFQEFDSQSGKSRHPANSGSDIL